MNTNIMVSLEQYLEKAFDVGHRVLQHLSENWRLHTNRRTIIVLVVAGFLIASLYVFAIEAPEDFPVDKLVEVPAGASLKEVAATLEGQHVVRSGLMLRLLITLLGDERTVHAGDYLFKEPRDIFRVARALSLGAYGLEPTRIRVPEGAMMKDMASVFDRQLERFDAANFIAQAQPQEGYFFPDTYFFLPNATEDTVIQAMRQNFDTHIATIAPQIASSTHSLSDIVIMASIVEREARNTKDSRTIAGVLWNRIAWM